MVLVTGIELVLILLGAIVLLSIGVMVVFVLVLRALVRRVRRSPAVGGTVLRTRARLSRGPQRTVLAMRVRLDEALHSGRAAVQLTAGTGNSGSRGELPRLFRRIDEESLVLDLQLRLMESETDSAVLADELPAARHRVEQVEGLVRRVRAAVASGLSGTTDDALSALGSDVDREVAALQAGIEELQALNRRDGRFAPTTRPPAASTVRDEGNRP
ncbi:hypothetical protein DCE93_02500 [Agromyces badenianii]|uniref:Secreted protein n=1 Tax=Agromyces badenianii TaxID=2080742 RepID=A0A2S0WTK3_9MICO|nr:hypothetical protein [Agromyces badenianii]AWB94665.1 hypothetical protein DCE93_02500 [Agromyces badenianii]